MNTIDLLLSDDGTDTAALRPAGAGTRAGARIGYQAPSPFGVLRLWLHDAPAPRHAADAAIALQRADALLAAFDAWSGLDADWRWAGTAEPSPDPATHGWADWFPDATALDPDAAPTARLELPWALLRRLDAPPAALQAQLRWPALPAAVVISRSPLPADELAALEPGGAVLLPESLERPWRGELRAAAEPARPGSGVPLELARPQSPRLLARTAVGPTALERPGIPGAEVPCEVRLAASGACGADRLAGWTGGELTDSSLRASLWRTDGEAARYLASGSLLPWGDGWALLVEAVNPAQL